MNAESKQGSFIIDSVARAVANWTVDRQAKQNAKLPIRYGDSWRTDWVGHTLSQLHMLAQALAVRSKDVFIHSVRWSLESFVARGIDRADLVHNLTCMHDVLAQELPAPVARSAIAYVDAAVLALDEPASQESCDVSSDSSSREPVLQYLQAILEGDRAAAESVITARLAGGFSVAEIYEKILSPAQERLGWMWHRGEISVADEHFGSATTQSVISQLRPHLKRTAPNGRTVVATSTPGDLHEIGLRMVSDLFEMDGWRVMYLGANTPIADVLEVMGRRSADLLAMSVSTALTLRDAGELIDAVRATAALVKSKVLVGGPPFKTVPDLWRELGADGCALSAQEAIRVANKLFEA